jgi:hypothetical protein
VAIRNRRKEGLLYTVVPPSTNTNDFSGSFGSQWITSGGKNTGAAVLARTICHSGMRRLQSGRSGSLYLAKGLLLIGQAESVVVFRVTTTRRQARASGLRSVSLPNVVCSFSTRPPSTYRLFHRAKMLRLVNASWPKSR